MKNTKRKFLLAGVISGGLFAGLMALYDYYNNAAFSIWKFVFFFLIFGLFNGLSQYWAVRNNDKNNSQSFNKKQ